SGGTGEWWRRPTSGARRLRSTSTVSALSGETDSTRQRSASGGTGSAASRSRHHRKAASVLPLPVGAVISVCRPGATALQPRSWTSVGLAKVDSNQARAGALKRSSEEAMVVSVALYAAG